MECATRFSTTTRSSLFLTRAPGTMKTDVANSGTDVFWNNDTLVNGRRHVFLVREGAWGNTRWNTIFKFYLQSWLYLSMAAASEVMLVRAIRTRSRKAKK